MYVKGKRVTNFIALALIAGLIFTGCESKSNQEVYPLDGPGMVAEFHEANFELSDAPEYSGKAYVSINENKPFFTDEEMQEAAESFEEYSDLDELGRCGVAMASVGEDLMPTEQRGSIYEIKPSGWQSKRYDIVEGGSLFNRCHLIAHSLTAENANEKNLITGTRYLNVDGMLPFEQDVYECVKYTKGHVLYRVTPVFKDDELVCRGVLLEAKSVEDDGGSLEFCIYCYNVQPGIYISYANGSSYRTNEDVSGVYADGVVRDAAGAKAGNGTEVSETEGGAYVLNELRKKIHKPDCESVQQMNENNRTYTSKDLSTLLDEGYEMCGNCF